MNNVHSKLLTPHNQGPGNHVNSQPASELECSLRFVIFNKNVESYFETKAT